ncbi:MAG TPA: hypothetical protein VFP29_13250, partial [Methyloceanibacter sp.]|nr:hypothetical protein [Methyloceanibacter sp.]
KDIEARYRIPITVTADEDMHISQFVIERGAEGAILDGESTVVHMDWAHHRESPAPASAASPALPPAQVAREEGEGEQRRGRGRRRRRKRHSEAGGEGHRPHVAEREGQEREVREPQEIEDEEASGETMAYEARGPEGVGEGGAQGQQRKGPRRRGRRGGRRGRPGQRPERVPGELEARGEPSEAREPGDREPTRHHDAHQDSSRQAREDRQNGDARASRSRPEEAFAREASERSRRDTEPVFSTIPTAREEPPAPPPASTAKKEAEQSSEPPRRGWWRR